MSLYGTKASSERFGPRPVWPYYAYSVCALIVAILACIIYWPMSIPERDELTLSGGKMTRLIIRDNFSGTGAGAMLPIFTTVYMKFDGFDHEFQYPWTFPKFHLVRDRTAVYVDIWVEKAALKSGETPLIWGLEEKNHYKTAEEQTIITLEEVIAGQQENGIMLIKVCLAMAALSVLFAFVAIAIGRRNRRKYPEYYPG